MIDCEKALVRLSKSKFRSRFHLSSRDLDYVADKGLDVIERHAFDFLNSRIRVKVKNDGKQTPMRGHPVFIAQHATATCCRNCIEKWYGFPTTKDLTDEEINDLVSVIMAWIKKEIGL